MSINPVFTTNYVLVGNQPVSLAALSRHLSELRKAFASEDLAGARKAFVQVQQLLFNLGRLSSGPLQEEIAGLSKALSSGDLSGARQAFSKVGLRKA